MHWREQTTWFILINHLIQEPCAEGQSLFISIPFLIHFTRAPRYLRNYPIPEPCAGGHFMSIPFLILYTDLGQEKGKKNQILSSLNLHSLDCISTEIHAYKLGVLYILSIWFCLPDHLTNLIFLKIFLPALQCWDPDPFHFRLPDIEMKRVDEKEREWET